MLKPSDAGALRKRIFAACRDLGLDDDARRDVVQAATGKASMSGMGAAELRLIETQLRAKGWKPVARRNGGARRRSESPRANIRFIHVLWRLLAEAGVMTPGVAALNGFINSTKFAAKWGHAERDVDMLPDEMAYDVIEALKQIAARRGVKIDR